MKKLAALFTLLMCFSISGVQAAEPTLPAINYLISIYAGNQAPEQDRQTVTYRTRERTDTITRSKICVQAGHTGNLTMTRTLSDYATKINSRGEFEVAKQETVLTSYFKIIATPSTKKDHIQLQVDIQTTTLSAANTQLQKQFSTTITVHPDRWVQLTGNFDRTTHSVTHATQRRSKDVNNYYVRIAEVEDCSE